MKLAGSFEEEKEHKVVREVIVLGVGMHPFGRFPELTAFDLGRVAALNALKDVGVNWKDVQAAYCGSVYQGTASGHKVIAQIGHTGIPVVNVENACSSGSSAFRLAWQAIGHGIYDVAIAIGFEKLGRGMIRSTAFDDAQRTMGHAVLMGIYALRARKHMLEHGTTAAQLAKVSVKNHKNGCLNPYAHYQEECSLEEVLNSRMVCDPVTLLMCAPTSDGAAAAVLCAKSVASRYGPKKQVSVAASVLNIEPYSSLLHPTPDIMEITAKEAYEMAGIGPEDLSVVEGYDASAVGEFLSYEALGLCPKGMAGPFSESGATEIGGKIPVSPSGGLLARGHPLGATGLAQIAELVWQLRGEAGKRQVAGAKVGMSHTMGSGGNCLMTILKR